MDYFVTALRQNPELAIFLAIAVGFLIGRLKLGGFTLGTVVGTLLAGVLIGQLDIKVPAVVKAVFSTSFSLPPAIRWGLSSFVGSSVMPCLKWRSPWSCASLV